MGDQDDDLTAKVTAILDSRDSAKEAERKKREAEAEHDAAAYKLLGEVYTNLIAPAVAKLEELLEARGHSLHAQRESSVPPKFIRIRVYPTGTGHGPATEGGRPVLAFDTKTRPSAMFEITLKTPQPAGQRAAEDSKTVPPHALTAEVVNNWMAKLVDVSIPKPWPG